MKTMLLSTIRFCCLVAAVALLPLVSGCEPETIPARVNAESLFTLKVNSIIDRPLALHDTPGQGKHYVVIGNAAGKLIEYKQLTPQTTFAFSKPEGFAENEITVTYVSYSDKWGYTVDTYRNVPVGQSWVASHLDKDSSSSVMTQTLNAKVRLSNIPANAKSFQPLTFTVPISSLQTNTDYETQIVKNGNDLWFRLDYSNQPPRFFLLRNVVANQTYMLDLSKFEPGVAKRIFFKKPAPLYWMSVVEKQQGSVLFWLDYFSSSQRIPLVDKVDFYLPNASFAEYDISAAVNAGVWMSNGEQTQLNGTFKSLPDILPLIEADFNVTRNIPGSFAMTTTGTFTYYYLQTSVQRTNQNPFLSWHMAGKAQPNVAFNYPEIPRTVLPVFASEIKMQEAGLALISDMTYEEALPTRLRKYSDYQTSQSRLIK